MFPALNNNDLRRFQTYYPIIPSCWEWNGERQKGYGIFYRWTTQGREKLRGHRVMWELSYGPIPPGIFVLHHCDNPPCVRPSHLFLGTALDNTRDMLAKGRGGSSPTSPGKLSPELVEEIRRRYAIEKITMQTLGAEYGVSGPMVHHIIHNKWWKE